MAALAIAASLLSYIAPVSYTGSDPQGTLLTAQALVEHGTFAVDAYPGALPDHRSVRIAGHQFYSYPPGTPLLSVPAVAVARLLGLNMSRIDHDHVMQRVLAAASVGALVVLAFLLASRWLSWPFAALLAASFVFSTPVMSTMGTAFWNSNAVVILTFAALLLLADYDAPAGAARAAAAGGCLGAAFWCRPPAFVIAGLAISWMFLRALRTPTGVARSAVVPAITLFVVVIASPVLLVLFSLSTYGTWLPDYYTGFRAGQTERFGTALWAHLISPSRGLLIYAPLGALIATVSIVKPARVLRFPLVGLALAWFGLHLLLVSRFPYWWGGYSYGSRLMVDVLPAVFVLLCATAAIILASGRTWRGAGLGVLVVLATIGAWVNSVEGLFNRATETWNVSPDIDHYPGYALDWRLPQFLASPERLEARLRRHEAWLRPPLEPGADYAAVSSEIDAEDGSSLRFLISEGTLRGASRLMLRLELETVDEGIGEVWFNGERIAQLIVDGGGPDFYVTGVPRRRVRTLEYDVLAWNTLEWRGAQGTAVRLSGLRVHPAR